MDMINSTETFVKDDTHSYPITIHGAFAELFFQSTQICSVLGIDDRKHGFMTEGDVLGLLVKLRTPESYKFCMWVLDTTSKLRKEVIKRF